LLLALDATIADEDIVQLQIPLNSTRADEGVWGVWFPAIILFFYLRYKRRQRAHQRFLQTRNSAGLHQYTVQALKVWGYGLDKDEIRSGTPTLGSRV
jgi:hypothetical protein